MRAQGRWATAVRAGRAGLPQNARRGAGRPCGAQETTSGCDERLSKLRTPSCDPHCAQARPCLRGVL